MRKPSKKTLIKKCDKLWRDIIKLRAKGKCELCNNPGIDAHHIIGRRNFTLRWDLRNGIYLCFNHHYGLNSAHQNPIWFEEELRKLKGDRLVEQLKFASQVIIKRSLADYQELHTNLKHILEAIK